MEQICPMVCKAGRNGGVERGCIKLLEEYQTFTRQQLIDELYRLNMTPYPIGNLSAYWDLYCRTLAVSDLLIKKTKKDKFDIGLIGGRFIDLHLGHKSVIDTLVDISKSLWIDIIEEGYKAEWDRAMVNMNTYRNPPTIEERGKLVTDYLSSKEFHNWELYEDREIFPIGLSEEKQWVIVVGADTFKDHALYLPQHVNPIREKNNLPFMLSIVIPIQRDKDGKGYAVRRDDIK